MDPTEAACRAGQRGNGRHRNEHHDEQLFREQADLPNRDQCHLLVALPPPTSGMPIYAVPSGITEMGIFRNTLAGQRQRCLPVGTRPEQLHGLLLHLDDPSYCRRGPIWRQGGPAFQSVHRRLGAGDPWPVAELADVPTADAGAVNVAVVGHGAAGPVGLCVAKAAVSRASIDRHSRRTRRARAARKAPLPLRVAA